MIGEVLLESELRGALNSIELSLDKIYQKLNYRACEMARKDIMLTSSLLRENLETIYDNEGRPLACLLTLRERQLLFSSAKQYRFRSGITKPDAVLKFQYGLG